jgi:hypothetical protein
MKKFCKNLLENLKERFPNRDLVKSMNVFNIENVLRLDDDQNIVLYGATEIRMLADHYGRIKLYKRSSAKKDYLPALICREDVLIEFSHFKYMIYFSYKNDLKFRALRNDKKWAQLFNLYNERFKSLFILARIVLSFPVSTVACERLFSKKNLIKTKTRNSLKTRTIDMLLRIGLLEFAQFESLQQEVVERFLQTKTRFESKYKKSMEIESKYYFKTKFSFVIKILIF